MAILLSITHLHMGLGGGSEMFVPAGCFRDGSGGCVLLIGQVSLFFDLEHLRVVVMHGAGAVPLRLSFSELLHRHGSRSVPGVEPCSNTVINERTFENRTGGQGEHIELRDKERERCGFRPNLIRS